MASLLLAAAPAQQLHTPAELIAKAKSAVVHGEAAAFSSLFCDGKNNGGSSWFRGTLTDVRLEPSTTHLGDNLAICFESPKTKETCALFAVERASSGVCLAPPVPSISAKEVFAYASAPYDLVENEHIVLGLLNGSPVVVDFICSDFCPDYTVRVIHYELREDQTCSSVGGVERELRIPVGIAATDEVFCFPKVLVDNWAKYQRKMSSVPPGVGPHE